MFKVSKTGTETVLYSFAGGPSDGCNPYGGLIRDAAGNLYGNTSSCGAYNWGTIYKVDTAGKETVLYSFNYWDDGASPYYSSLIMDAKGNLYGVNDEGGSFGRGTVYKLSKTGKFKVLHNFAGGTTDGCYPYGTPALDKSGNLYGTTESCGSSSEGTVWEVSKAGVETVLHNFAGGSSDGGFPLSGVIMDAKGNLYGVTESGGSSGLGTVYELNSTGVTVLHSFAGGSSDGEFPFGGPVRDAKGNLYGTTPEGGSNYGTVWKVTPKAQ